LTCFALMILQWSSELATLNNRNRSMHVFYQWFKNPPQDPVIYNFFQLQITQRLNFSQSVWSIIVSFSDRYRGRRFMSQTSGSYHFVSHMRSIVRRRPTSLMLTIPHYYRELQVLVNLVLTRGDRWCRWKITTTLRWRSGKSPGSQISARVCKRSIDRFLALVIFVIHRKLCLKKSSPQDLMTEYLGWSQGLNFEVPGPFPEMEIISEAASRQRHIAQVGILTHIL